MAASLEFAQTVLKSQPFSQLLNAQLVSFNAKVTELRVPITPQLKQQHNFVHGGVISYIADNALTFAGGAILGSAVVTSEYKINFIRPAKGQALLARASVIHAGRTQAVCQCQVFVLVNGKEILCALAQGTIASLDLPK